MSRPAILMTASTLPRWPADTEPEFILQLAAALTDRYRVTVLAPHYPGAAVDEDMGGVRIHRYRYAPESWQTLAYSGGMLHRLRDKPLRWLLVPGFLLGQLLAILRLHRRERFDLLHAHWIVPQGLVAAVLKSLGLFRGPFVLSSHGGDLFSLQGRFFQPFKRWIVRCADQINVVSNAMVTPAVELGASPASLLVRSMGIDTTGRFTCNESGDSRSGVVFVGRLVEKKGVDVLVRAFAEICSRRADQTLRIIGDGPLREELEQLSSELGCADKITFVGAVPNRDVPGELNRACVAVVPSVVASDGDQEGLGLVAVEAMACGCAVVCSSLPALQDVVTDGETGSMVEPGDHQALGRAIEAQLEDSTLRTRLAEAGRNVARSRFDWRAVAADFSILYEDLLNQRENARR